jgi:TolA-binding protein
MKNLIALTLGIILLTTTSCASLWPFGSHKSKKAATEGPTDTATPEAGGANPETVQGDSIGTAPNTGAPKTTAATPQQEDDAALRQARMTARMEAIEKELIHQRETIRLLEQGLLTGIPPEDLKKSAAARSPKVFEKPVHLESEDLSIKIPKTVPPPHEDLSTSAAGGSLTAKLEQAKELYQASRFGLAIADLAVISREFGTDAAEGAVRVWLGKSYLGLKEYRTAGDEFQAYLKGWPSGEYVARTRLDLAKVYVGLGLKERARGELRRVIKDFDGNDEAEMASLELKNIQGAL